MLLDGSRVKQTWNKSAPDLCPYQEEDVKMMLYYERTPGYGGGILANEMGLGKTGWYWNWRIIPVYIYFITASALSFL